MKDIPFLSLVSVTGMASTSSSASRSVMPAVTHGAAEVQHSLTFRTMVEHFQARLHTVVRAVRHLGISGKTLRQSQHQHPHRYVWMHWLQNIRNTRLGNTLGRNLVSAMLLLSLLAGRLPTTVQAETIQLDRSEAAKASWVTVFAAEARKDPTVAVRAQYLLQVYQKYPTYSDVNKVVQFVERAVDRYHEQTDVGLHEVDRLDAFVSTLVAGATTAFPEAPLIATGLGVLFNHPVDRAKEFLQDQQRVLVAHQRLEAFEMSRNGQYEEIGARFFDLASKNAYVLTASHLSLATTLGIQVGEKADTMRQRRSDVLQHPVLDRLQPDGSLVLSEADVLRLFQEHFDTMIALMAENREGLKHLDQQQQHLLQWFKDQAKRDQAAEDEAQRAPSHELKLKAAQAGVSLLSTVLGFANPKLAREVSIVGTSAIQIAEGISRLRESAALLGTAANLTGALGSIVATGNIVGAVMQVFSLFQDSGPSPEQMILEQLAALREQVAHLREEMHSRFDRVDAALNTIYDKLVEVDWQVDQLAGKVDEIQVTLLGLQADLNHLHRRLYVFLDEGFRMQLREAINGCLGYRERAGIDLTYQPEFLTCENVFQTWAAIFAADQLRAGPYSRDVTAESVFEEMSTYPLVFNINYLSQYLWEQLGLAPLAAARLANPLDLATAAEAYVQLARENPGHAQRIAPSRLQAIKDVAFEVQVALQNIANPALFTALLNNYTAQVGPVQQAIEAIADAYQNDPVRNKIKLVDIWSGANQALNYTPPLAQIDGCDGRSLGLSLPTNLEQLFGLSNPYRLADYLARNAPALGFGQVGLCVEAAWVDPHEEYVEDTGYWYGWIRSAKLWLQIHLTFQGRAVHSRRLIPLYEYFYVSQRRLGGEWEPDRNPYEAVPVAWERSGRWGNPLREQFAATSYEVLPTAQEQSDRAQLLSNVTAQIEQKLREYQIAVYSQIVHALSAATPLHEVARTLSGSKLLLDGYVALGLSRSLESNDLLRALLFGSQRVLDTDAILDLYYTAIATLQTGQAVPKVDIPAIATARHDALARVLTDTLAQVAQGQMHEDLRVVENTLRMIDIYEATPARCTYTLAPTRRALSHWERRQRVTVTAPNSCGWTAVSQAPWITISTGSRGSGDGIVEYLVTANLDAASRTGTLTIAGQIFTIQQGGNVLQVPGDYNNDQATDILLRHSSGALRLWLIQGIRLLRSTNLGGVDPAWQVVGTGDYDDNGAADILWRHSSGRVSVWLMEEGRRLRSVGLGGVDPAWQVVGTGDYDANGTADILWQHTSGMLKLWLMDGATPLRQGSPGSVEASWAIVDLGP